MRIEFVTTLILATAFMVAGCSSGTGGNSSQSTDKSIGQITGAGATLAFPVYSQWAEAYFEKTGVKINYQPIGSGAGIRMIKKGTVDFGASDVPLKLKELKKYGLMQFPMVMGGIVPVVHIPGIKPGQLRLTGKVLAGIYRGVIQEWDDPRIQKLNPNLDLPDQEIVPVYRSDGSGTTWIFTNYLAKVSGNWAEKVGYAKAVAWPTGVGGKGNQGVASYVERIENSIGYVAYSYALQNDMTYVALKNKAGNFVRPTPKTFQSAAANADWEHAPGMYIVLTYQPGEKSWPITGASYILIHEDPKSPAVVRQILQFFAWAYHDGGQMAKELGYVPMPPNVVQFVQKAWHQEVKTQKGESLRSQSKTAAHKKAS